MGFYPISFTHLCLHYWITPTRRSSLLGRGEQEQGSVSLGLSLSLVRAVELLPSSKCTRKKMTKISHFLHGKQILVIGHVQTPRRRDRQTQLAGRQLKDSVLTTLSRKKDSPTYVHTLGAHNL